VNRGGVVVTGLGPVTPIGVGEPEFHRGQLAGRTGVRTITLFDPAALPVRIGGEIDLPAGIGPSRREAAGTDRCTHLAAAAAELAVRDSGLNLSRIDPDRVGVVVGTGVGGTSTWERASRTAFTRGHHAVSPRFIQMAMANNAASWISTHYGLTGPCTAPVMACASGAEALVQAYHMITSGEVDLVLAGGGEAPLTPTVLAGFANMRALSRRNADPSGASRPFSVDRDGFVLAEGAAILVLESAEHAHRRGAEPMATFAGYGRSSDAYSMTAPRPDGDGGRRAVLAALRMAGLRAADIDYINAHGTGTRYNDAAEAQVLHAALGDVAGTVPVSATKSMTGHTLGAAGAIEAVAAIQAIRSGVVPPTINLDDPDRELKLDVVGGEPREAKIGAVLSNSFAFGGHNVVLIFTHHSGQ
jgi:3-oxoacyl-[acyl-carrier-protein] synthase II